MKLYSAIGIEDFSNPLSVQPTADNVSRRLGPTDLFHACGHPSFVPIPTPGKGMNFSTYGCSDTFMLRDIIAEYPTGDCWVALGVMVDPIVIGGGNGVFFQANYNGRYDVTASIGSMTRNDLMVVAGQSKRCCLEVVYKPLTGQYRVYVNGVVKQAGTFSQLSVNSYPLVNQGIAFNGYHTSDSTSRFFVTDCYFGVVDGIDACLGNFKITKLVAKTSTLNVDGMTPGGAGQLTTGDHVVEFDTAPLAGQVVLGVAETVRAFSVGPTAAVTTKRTVNGVATAARKASNIPIVIPTTFTEDFAVQRVMSPPTNYAYGTPLTECKLALSIVNN
jgi:hypothetical protein